MIIISGPRILPPLSGALIDGPLLVAAIGSVPAALAVVAVNEVATETEIETGTGNVQESANATGMTVTRTEMRREGVAGARRGAEVPVLTDAGMTELAPRRLWRTSKRTTTGVSLLPMTIRLTDGFGRSP